MKLGYIRMSRKLNNDPPSGCFQMSRIWRKLCSRNIFKKMIACFFDHAVHIATILVEDKNTVCAKWYTEFFCQKSCTKKKTQQKSPHRPHRDNTSSHTACETMDYLKDKNVEVIAHCPYSSDLLPDDFFFVPLCQKRNASATIFITWRSCLFFPKLCFSYINFSVEKLCQELVWTDEKVHKS